MWDTDEIAFLTCCEWDTCAELWRCWDLRSTNCAIRKVEMVIYIDTTKNVEILDQVCDWSLGLGYSWIRDLILDFTYLFWYRRRMPVIMATITCTVFDIKIIFRHECRTNNGHLRSHSKSVVLHLDIEDFGYHGNGIFRCCDLSNRK